MGGIHIQRNGLQDLTKLQILVQIKIIRYIITYLTIHMYSVNVHQHKKPTILSTTSGKMLMVFVYTLVAQCALHALHLQQRIVICDYAFCA